MVYFRYSKGKEVLQMTMTIEELRTEWDKWWDSHPGADDVSAMICGFAHLHSNNFEEYNELVQDIYEVFY
jgi:hypothetical protein